MTHPRQHLMKQLKSNNWPSAIIFKGQDSGRQFDKKFTLCSTRSEEFDDLYIDEGIKLGQETKIKKRENPFVQQFKTKLSLEQGMILPSSNQQTRKFVSQDNKNDKLIINYERNVQNNLCKIPNDSCYQKIILEELQKKDESPIIKHKEKQGNTLKSELCKDQWFANQETSEQAHDLDLQIIDLNQFQDEEKDHISLVEEQKAEEKFYKNSDSITIKQEMNQIAHQSIKQSEFIIPQPIKETQNQQFEGALDPTISREIRQYAIERMIIILHLNQSLDVQVLIFAIQLFDNFLRTKKFLNLSETNPNTVILTILSCLSLSSQYLDDMPLSNQELAQTIQNNNFSQDDIYEMCEKIFNTEGFTLEFLDLSNSCITMITEFLNSNTQKNNESYKSIFKPIFTQKLTEYVEQISLTYHIQEMNKEIQNLEDFKVAIVLLALKHYLKDLHLNSIIQMTKCNLHSDLQLIQDKNLDQFLSIKELRKNFKVHNIQSTYQKSIIKDITAKLVNNNNSRESLSYSE
ncbi:UNKNOWN [Stylonychia lemnae]|uniref:Cyclin-like domain-containing protein n=1 Tax=Stylonychia lemnae TaxID=5949 RepID=A0A078A435_STYLE|nr:UNKNOWN [Stylonychia lemnae]|eukprot:CDW76288.1 UNKNOWN [Stylonychia lemnae]